MTGFPWSSLATETWLLGLGLALVALDIVVDRRRKHTLGYVALAGLLLALIPAAGICAGADSPERLFGGLYLVDDFQRFFRLLAVSLTALVVLLSQDYLEHIRLDRGVYFCLLVLGALAMILLAGANNLLLIYLAFEYLSLTSYILVGFLLGRDKRYAEETRKSAEASLKYLIFGAVASGVMLYGFSLLYGLTGSLNLEDLAAVYAGAGNEMLKLVAVALVTVGLGFKIAAAPFHQWAPDVYEGAPTPVAAFLAVGSKAAAFAVLARFFVSGLGLGDYASPLLDWRPFLAVIAVVTMFAGNMLAILQTNLKRLLGYSSVAHAGYLVVAVIANHTDGEGVHLPGLQALLMYLAVYFFMTLGAFAVAVWYERSSGSDRIDDYAGLGQRAPLPAAAMLIFMLSLTGIPPTAGFIGKLYLLLATIQAPGYWWLGVLIVVNSVISAFYYMNVVRVMYYLDPRDSFTLRPAFASPSVIGLCAVATLALMLQFGLLLDLSAAPLGTLLGG